VISLCIFINSERSNCALGVMKAIIFPFVLSLFLCACAVRTSQYYLPTDSTLVKEGTVCGTVSFGSARIPLGEELHASVSAIPSGQHIGLSIQLSLPLDAKVRFLKPELTIEVPGSERAYSGHLAPFHVSVYGKGGQPGHHESVDPSTVLEGKGRNMSLATADSLYLKSDLYISSAVIATSPSDSVILVFPAVEVNGAVIEVQRVPLRLVERTGVLACVQ
jgi:hypothetical protein